MKELTNMVEMELLEAIGCDGEYADTYPVALANELPAIGDKVLVLNNCKATVTEIEEYQDYLEFTSNQKFYTVYYILENGLRNKRIVTL